MIAFVFPGQGSQRPGMGQPWIDVSPELFALASDAAGIDVARLTVEADEEELRRTDAAQLATAVCSLAALDALRSAGVTPDIVAGHSLGEYPALVASGAIDPAAGVRLVAERGASMRTAADRYPGTMAALVGADVDLAAKACESVDGVVVVANHNAADQVVISGSPDALEAAAEAAKGLGAKRVMPLRVGGAFHSPLMAPALPRLAAAIAATRFVDASVPVVCNVDAAAHTAAGELVPLLLAQLCAPVRWHDGFATILDAGVTAIVEVGQGGVLSKLAQRALGKESPVLVTSVSGPDDAAAVADALAAHHEVAAALHDPLAGVPDMIDRAVCAPAAGRFEPAPAAGDLIEAGTVLGDVVTDAGRVSVRAAFDGWIRDLLAPAGGVVHAGQPLLTVRPLHAA